MGRKKFEKIPLEEIEAAKKDYSEEQAREVALTALSMTVGAVEHATEVLERIHNEMPGIISELERRTTVKLPENFAQTMTDCGKVFAKNFTEAVIGESRDMLKEIRKNQRRVSIPDYMFCFLAPAVIALVVFTTAVVIMFPAILPIFWKCIGIAAAWAATLIAYHQYTIRFPKKDDNRRKYF